MVVLNLEMIHEDRIVYTDGRPPLKAVQKQYMGEPRGRWDGNTLVITTTNYKEGPSGTNIGVFGSPQGNRWPVSDQMKTTERLSRLNDNTILYEIKVEDPLIRCSHIRCATAAARQQNTSGGNTTPRRQSHDSRLHQRVAQAAWAAGGRYIRCHAVASEIRPKSQHSTSFAKAGLSSVRG